MICQIYAQYSQIPICVECGEVVCLSYTETNKRAYYNVYGELNCEKCAKQIDAKTLN